MTVSIHNSSRRDAASRAKVGRPGKISRKPRLKRSRIPGCVTARRTIPQVACTLGIPKNSSVETKRKKVTSRRLSTCTPLFDGMDSADDTEAPPRVR